MEEQDKDINTSPEAQDPIKQLKGEFGRKFDTVAQSVSELKQINAVLAEKLTQLAAPRQTQPVREEKLEDIAYTDPKRYAEIIKQQTKQEVYSEMQAMEQQKQRTTTVLAELHSEFPELAEASNPLTKKAAEIYGNLPVEERQSPLSYKLAVKEAASELNVKPKSKRTYDESFVGSSGGTTRPRKNAEKLSPITETWAELLNVDITNPEVKARLIQRSQRNWKAPQSPTSTKRGKK